jgi:hypothetical protein
MPFVAGMKARSPSDETVGFYDLTGNPVLLIANDGSRITVSRGPAADAVALPDLPPVRPGPVSLGRILSGLPGYPVEEGDPGRTEEGAWSFEDGRQTLVSDARRRFLSRAEYRFQGTRVTVSYPGREATEPPPVVRVEVRGTKIELRRDAE